jgi:hypothetical protein
MSHQDPTSHTAPSAHHQALKQVPDRLLAPAALANIRFRPDSTWTPRASMVPLLSSISAADAAVNDR